MTTASEIVGVNGRTYSDDALRDAVAKAEGGKDPIRLIVRSGRTIGEVPVQWSGGLRYPRLEKVGVGDGSLDRLLAPLP